MPWVVDPASSYTDTWRPDLAGRTWYRRLDRTQAAYLYKSTSEQPAYSTLFGPLHPNDPQELRTDVYRCDTSDDVAAIYRTAEGLISNLAGLLRTVEQNGNAPAAAVTAARNALSGIPDSLQQATAAIGVVNLPGSTDAQRNQAMRRALRYLMDVAAAAQTLQHHGPNPAEIPFLGAVARRVSTMTTQAYQRVA